MTDLATADPRAQLDAEDWAVWLAAIFPQHCTHPFAPHHADLWDWIWALEPDARPEAFVAIWPRGGAKSTSAEMAGAVLAAKGLRRYGLYVCETQDQADKHVGNVGAMLESDRVALFYPDLGRPQVNKQGNSRGWRHNRLATAAGFVLDAVGLDTAVRGLKFDEARPDFIILDDVDGRFDTPAQTAAKVVRITESILPAADRDRVAVLAIQNLVIPDGVFAQIADGRAKFLRRRTVSGPIPALRSMTVTRDPDTGDDVIDGEPTWAGQSVESCRQDVEDWGLEAFLREAQHEVADAEGALWTSDQLAACRVETAPELGWRVVSVDPSGGKGKGHDSQGIVAVGAGVDGLGYVLGDWTPAVALSAAGWGRRAVEAALAVWADEVIVEDNYGGDSMLNTVQSARDDLVREGHPEAEWLRSLPIRPVNAKGRSKQERALPVSALYGQKERPETWPGRVRHVGVLGELEREMRQWDPAVSRWSPNRVDALVHGVDRLGLGPAARGRGGLRSRRAA